MQLTQLGECELEGVQPCAMVSTPNGRVKKIRALASERGHLVRIEVTDAEFMRGVAALERRVLKEWYDMEGIELKRGESEMSIYIPPGARLYDKDTGTWMDAPDIAEGDRLSITAMLRRRGYHTITDEYQVMVYDCDSIICSLITLLRERDNAVMHNGLGPEDTRKLDHDTARGSHARRPAVNDPDLPIDNADGSGEAVLGPILHLNNDDSA